MTWFRMRYSMVAFRPPTTGIVAGLLSNTGARRNENEKYFSITLAGVGAAGNLKHCERIF
jgi:hypothetical protein